MRRPILAIATVLALIIAVTGSRAAVKLESVEVFSAVRMAKPLRDDTAFYALPSDKADRIWHVDKQHAVMVLGRTGTHYLAFGPRGRLGYVKRDALALKTSVASYLHAQGSRTGWIEVGQWTGRTSKQTPLFMVGLEWKISWQTAGEDNFSIRVIQGPDQWGDLIANFVGSDDDETYMHEAGRFCLRIDTSQPWTVTVSEKL